MSIGFLIQAIRHRMSMQKDTEKPEPAWTPGGDGLQSGSRNNLPLQDRPPQSLSQGSSRLPESKPRNDDESAIDCENCLPVYESAKRQLMPSPRVISDAIIGLSDGLQVPFALSVGLSSTGNHKVIIMGGLAEVIAGMISMGLGGFLGNKSEIEAYEAAEKKADAMIDNEPDQVTQILHKALVAQGLTHDVSTEIVKRFGGSRDALRHYLLQYHFDMLEPDRTRPWKSAFTIGISYFLGGLLPLIPYLAIKQNPVGTVATFADILPALCESIGIMAFALVVFGYCKTGFSRGAWKGQKNVLACIRGATIMLLVGSLAAGVAAGVGWGLNSALPSN